MYTVRMLLIRESFSARAATEGGRLRSSWVNTLPNMKCVAVTDACLQATLRSSWNINSCSMTLASTSALPQRTLRMWQNGLQTEKGNVYLENMVWFAERFYRLLFSIFISLDNNTKFHKKIFFGGKHNQEQKGLLSSVLWSELLNR